MEQPIIGTDERVMLTVPEPPAGRAYVLVEISDTLHAELLELHPRELQQLNPPVEQLVEGLVRNRTPRPQPIRKVTLENGGAPDAEPGSG